jgi:hypothetical protein
MLLTGRFAGSVMTSPETEGTISDHEACDFESLSRLVPQAELFPSPVKGKHYLKNIRT